MSQKSKQTPNCPPAHTACLPSFVLGTAGHIDHGKSTLVRTLTGTDPDRLAEEKRRGITIELGFAQLQLPNGSVCGVVDVPGHERFVRHMVEGATGVDVALLVVAADDGVMIQTREHLTILELLGVRKLIVAITKIDTVDPELVELAQLDVAELLSSTSFDDADIIPVSAHTKEGIDSLLAAIESAATSIKREASSDFVRLPIDRVFSIEGTGTVVTGTLWDGIIKVDDQLEVLQHDSSRQVRVRNIQVHGKDCMKARSGQRVALNLVGVKREEIKRGDVLCTPKRLQGSTRFLAKLHYTGLPDRSTNKSDASPEPTFKSEAKLAASLKDGAAVVVHHGTDESAARIKLLYSEDRIAKLAAEESAYVQVRLDKALPLRFKDRFIIRNLSPAFTTGGGKVLLTEVGQRTKLAPEWFELLEMLDADRTADAIELFVSLQGLPFNSEEVAVRLGLDKAVVARTLNQLPLSRLKGEKANHFIPADALNHLQDRVEKDLLAYHEENPQALNLSQGALRGIAFTDAATSPQALAWTSERFELLLELMAEAGTINLDAGKVSHPKASSSAQALFEQCAAQLLTDIESQGLMVSNISEHAQRLEQSRNLIAQVLGRLLVEGKLIRLASEYYFAPKHIALAQETLRQELLNRGEGMTAAEIRNLWQISRKYAIPLLEHCDAQGITRREGDLRFLKDS